MAGPGIQPNQLAPAPNVVVADTVAPVTGAGKGVFYPKDVGDGVIEGFFKDAVGNEIQLTEDGALLAEVNTAANVGAGAGVWKDKQGVNLRFKTLVAGANITITPAADTVTIAATDTGEANTGSSEGDGEDVYIGKTGVNLRFRSLVAGENIALETDGSEIIITNTFEETGEANTGSNLGDGEPVFVEKDGVDFKFKTLKAGTGTVFNVTEDEIEIVSTGGGGGGEANSGLNVGSGTGNVYKTKVGTVLHFKRLQAGSGVTITDNESEIVIAATGGGGGGEANTASNVGTGVNVFKQKVGVDLQFRKILAGTGISVAIVSDDVVITNTATGEANTASNVGASGVGIFKTKSGVDLQFKKLIAGTGMTVTGDTDDVTLATTAEANTASNVGTGEGSVFKAKTGVDLAFRKIKAGSGITVTQGTDDITVAATGGGGGDSIYEYAASVVSGDECWVRATGEGVTYSRTGTTGTFVVPEGVKILSFMIRTAASMASATFTLIHDQGTNAIESGFPPIVQVWNDGASKTIRSTASATLTDPDYDRLQFTGLSATTAHRIRGSF